MDRLAGRSILDFSISAAPCPERLMGILRAFGDESGKLPDPKIRYISMASVIGQEHHWRDFLQRWGAMLLSHEIPYLHMKEVVGARHSKKGPFAKFANPDLLLALLGDVANCLIDSGLFCCALSVETDALKRVLRAHGMKADPYSFTLYQNVVSLGTWALNNHAHDPAFHLVLDRIERGHSKVSQAQKLYEADSFASWRGWPAVTPMPMNDRRGAREILELQAADAVAWSVRNQLNHIGRWMRDIKPTLGPMKNDGENWSQSLFDWLVVRNRELAATSIERINFLVVWARLSDEGALKYYAYDEERLENHIFKHRDRLVEPHVKEEAINLAGRDFPLSP